MTDINTTVGTGSTGTKVVHLVEIEAKPVPMASVIICPPSQNFRLSYGPDMEAYNYTVQLTKKSRNYLLMTAAAGSSVLLCIATGQFEKRSRIFEKENIYYQFLFFIYIW